MLLLKLAIATSCAGPVISFRKTLAMNSIKTGYEAPEKAVELHFVKQTTRGVNLTSLLVLMLYFLRKVGPLHTICVSSTVEFLGDGLVVMYFCMYMSRIYQQAAVLDEGSPIRPLLLISAMESVHSSVLQMFLFVDVV